MKIKDIISGTKKRKKRGSRIKRIIGDSLHKPIREGGNIFPDSVSFDHKIIPNLMQQINSVLAKTNTKAIPIGSGATPTPGKMSGDLDMIVDLADLQNAFNMQDQEAKVIRKKLRQQFDLAGFNTGQSGTSVHVEVPIGDNTHQIDIMIVANAETASKFHTHNIPQGSKFKGVNKMITIAKLAKEKGMKWSPYKGLVNRDTNELISSNLDDIAKRLLGPNARGQDLGSVESILSALGKEAGDALLADLRDDPGWKELD
tara:strand:- start:1082 stop:1855 length:774 start_codon:yes stop_codon:yes gene_type:complete